MNRALISLVLVLTLAVTPSVSWALSGSAVLTDDQVEYIRNNCADTQSALRSLYATDAVARVNLGQQYEAVSARLMAPMNSRIALNKLDGVALAKTTVDFNNELDNFRKTLYSPYKEELSEIVLMKCYDQPIEFYDKLTTILELRTKLRVSINQLGKLLGQYRSQLATVEKAALAGGQN